MKSNEEMRIVYKPNQKFPYEVWFGNDLVETFVSEETAKIMVDLQKQMRELYFRNQYEKSISKK